MKRRDQSDRASLCAARMADRAEQGPRAHGRLKDPSLPKGGLVHRRPTRGLSFQHHPEVLNHAFRLYD
jgi:hypothetical protein